MPNKKKIRKNLDTISDENQVTEAMQMTVAYNDMAIGVGDASLMYIE